MAYQKNNWAIFDPNIPEDYQPDAFLSKAKLDNIETGIEEAHKLAEAGGTSANISIGDVVEGETAAAEIVDGKLNLTIPKGPAGDQGLQGEVGPQGEPGVTPVKGTDYFTEEDKNEIIESVLATQKNEPYYDEELNKFFACGVHVNIYAADEAGKLKITWLTDGSHGQELIVPENIDFFGGCASADKVAYYPATSIMVYSGKIDSVIGGCFGNGLVGNTTIVVNGGTMNFVAGGGMHWADKNAHHNNVGHADIILNNADKVDCACGGTPSGVCTTGTAKIVINDGNYGVVMVGGTNGYTGSGEIIINGGTVRSVQAGNRGTLGNSKITVNGGTITNAVYGGVGDTGTYIKSELILNGGTIPKVEAGKYAGKTDTTAERIFGTYVDGLIDDAMAEAMHLTKVQTIDTLSKKIADLEALVTE